MDAFDEPAVRKKAVEDGITHISTGVAIVRNGKILMAKRAAGEFLGGVYELPGGGVDNGETIIEGAIREVREETGLVVSSVISTFAGFDYSTDKKPHVRQINFLVEVGPGEVRLDPREHSDHAWISGSDYENLHMTENMKKCVASAT